DRFEDVARRFDTIVLGPHASAAFPEELRPFINADLSRRKQFDFSDVITGPVGRAWASADEQVVFVENPHARIVVDPNREHGADPGPTLRECFSRIRDTRENGKALSLAGVDQVRPITFSGEDVLLEPEEAAGKDGETKTPGSSESWADLVEALKISAALGPDIYEAAVKTVVEAVRAARPKGPLTVIGFHDTNEWKMRQDGALVVERPEADRMPPLVNFGNQGNFSGDPLEGKAVLTPGPEMRRIADAWASAFRLAPGQDFLQPKEFAHMEPVSFNRPYPGGHEVRFWSAELRDMPRCIVYQVEFARAALLGHKAAAELRQPGSSWPATDDAHVAWVAERLKDASDVLRRASCP
ncbi:unnamed protein product, partial [Polarella glacialis]